MNRTFGAIILEKYYFTIGFPGTTEISDWRYTKMTKPVQKCSTSTRISIIRTWSVYECELRFDKGAFKAPFLAQIYMESLCSRTRLSSVIPPSPTIRAQLDPATNASNPTIHDSAAIKDGSLQSSLHVEAHKIHHHTLISSCLLQHLKSTMLASTKKPLSGMRIKNM